MRNLVIKIFCFCLTIVLAVTSSFICAHSYEMFHYNSFIGYDDVTLMRNENQIYLIGTKENDVQIEALYPNEYNISLSLQQEVSIYTLCSDVLVLVSFLNDNDSTKVTLYDITDDVFNSFIINDDDIYMTSHFAYSNGLVYIATQKGKISCYSKAGKYYGEYYLGTDVYSLITDFENNVYALTSSGIFSIYKDGYTKISNKSFSTRGCFIDYDVFVDELGNFYQLSESNKMLDVYCDSIYPCGGIYSKYFITFYGNKIYAYNRKTQEKSYYYTLNNNILELYSIDNRIVALTYSENVPNIIFLSFEDLKKITVKNNHEDNENSANIDTSSITSATYNVDFYNMKITNIPHKTTVAQFKKNMVYDGYKVEFYRYEKDTPLKSGNVGTATQAIFYNNTERYVFELSVIGDLTGEGNVNSRDKKQIFSQVVGRIEMTGVFLDSADLDNSSNIDVRDIVLLLKMIKTQETNG